jgi:signal transduction histidine kinase
MSRPWQIWLTFAVCLAIAVAAVGWLSVKALQTDAAQAEAAHQAAIEENARLALWRMDSFLAPIIAQENAQPFYVYSAFYPVEEPYNWTGLYSPDKSLPSPLLSGSSPNVLIHFQIGPNLAMTSPEVPRGKRLEEKAVPAYLSAEKFQQNGKLLDGLSESFDAPKLLSYLPAADNPTTLAQSTEESAILDRSVAMTQNDQSQSVRGQNEYQARVKSFIQNNVPDKIAQSEGIDPRNHWQWILEADVRTSMMILVWSSDKLLLARRVKHSNNTYVQGCLLNWPAIRKSLLVEIADLLPEATLQPVKASSDESQVHQMASLPVVLIPGTLSQVAVQGLSPIKQSLIFSWAALAVAAVAAAAVLRGVVSLSERRAAFVSAVTHELRTPLTTFRMYAEMLREGMVTNETDRVKYLDTLRAEADRLTHLVANVLAYARLERGRPSGQMENIPVAQLLEKTTVRAAERAAEAKFQLSVEPDNNALNCSVMANPTAVEQILFNLADNACKYAASATDRTLHLTVTKKRDSLEIRLRDHGPGVSSEIQRRLFQAFRKSAQEAAHSAPGIGLGLALSRRLAHHMQGDLQYESTPGTGALFVLSLPLA